MVDSRDVRSAPPPSLTDLTSQVTDRTGVVPMYYEYPGAKVEDARLGDKEYGQAMQAMVIVCVDVVLVGPDETFYLVTRRALPMDGLWWLGGRVFPNEPFEKAALRKLKQEAGFTVEPARLLPLGFTRYVWARRQQPPQDAGSDNLCVTFALEVTPEEAAHVASRLDPNEYVGEAGLRPYGREELRALVEQGLLHEVIWDHYLQVFGRR